MEARKSLRYGGTAEQDGMWKEKVWEMQAQLSTSHVPRPLDLVLLGP